MKKLGLSAGLIAVAAPAMAHPGHGDAFGVWQGLVHPLMGADHLLAMLAVGLWSGFVLGRRFWAGAATFMAAMLAGAGLAWAGIGFPLVETVILASVVAFGGLTLVSRKGQPPAVSVAALVAIGVFALAHGHAHATEATGNAAGYVTGFLTATALLHLLGVMVARAVAGRLLVQQVAGAGIALSGLLLMAG